MADILEGALKFRHGRSIQGAMKIAVGFGFGVAHAQIYAD